MKWLQNLPIHQKLTLVILLICSVVLLLACGVLAAYQVFDFRRAMVNDTKVLADVLAKNTQAALAFQDQRAAQQTLLALQAEPAVIAARLYDERANRFADYIREGRHMELPSEPSLDGARFEADSLVIFRPIFLNDRRIGTIYLQTSLDGMYERLSVFVGVAVLALVGSVLVALALSSWLQRPISQPILALANTARFIARDKDYTVRVPTQGHNEIGLLTGAINQLLASIEERDTALRMTNESLHQEITERKGAEERFRTLADAAPMLVWEAGSDRLHIYFNKTWLDFVGRGMAQEIGNGWTENVHPDDLDRYLKMYESSFGAHRPFELEHRLRHHTGAYRWILERGAPRFNSQGTLLGYIGACIDITDSVQARETLAERREELERLVNERTASLQEAIAQMEEFSYSVSHDLRAPLRAMQAYSTALLEDYGHKIDAEGQEYLQRIVSSGVRMDRLTQDVLTYSKIPRTAMRLDRVSLNTLVPEILQQIVPERTSRLNIIVETPLLEVRSHESLMTQVVSNLIDNAIKFSSSTESARIRIWTEAREEQVRLWVEDSGIGIKPEHQGRIWGMFERVHHQNQYEGTGIGLAIVRKAVEKMNGKIGLVSDGLSGSKFWIQLPRA